MKLNCIWCSLHVNFSDSEHILSQLSKEEQKAAKESLSIYIKPIELYKDLRIRADRNPSFLQDCLRYKIDEKNKRRVQLSVSRSQVHDDGLDTLLIFPIYVLLARPVPTPNEETLRYRFKRACKLTAFNGPPTLGSSQPRFILPEIEKLTEFKSGSLAILLVSFADQTDMDLTQNRMVSPSNDGYCLMGEIPIDFLQFSREKSPNISLGEGAEFTSSVSLESCRMKLSCSDGEKCVSFLFRDSFKLVEVPITITAEELGASSSTDKRSQVVRPRTGEVLFNYRYYYGNKLHITQVTEDYTCPFCLLKCASYEGLECHLPASHDLFNYVFLGEGRYQVVIVSAKITSSSAEIVGKKLEPREKAFNFCRMSTRRRKPGGKNQNANHAALDSNMPGVVSERLDCEPTAADVSIAADTVFSGPEEASPSVPGSSVTPTTLRKSARSRKLRKGRNARNQSLLERRQFFHSHTGQPMSPEQVFAEEDSEDEVDDEVLDLEDRMRLDRFKDVSQHEKRLMLLWNSFMRKQRVVADGHIPWACEAFTTKHRQDFLQSPELRMFWTLFMIKLWNHGLLDAKTMDNCRCILNSQNPENKN
ncbi:putative transcription factor C2H2 family [Helianthus debilis subsp. tardiflorus]